MIFTPAHIRERLAAIDRAKLACRDKMEKLERETVAIQRLCAHAPVRVPDPAGGPSASECSICGKWLVGGQ